MITLQGCMIQLDEPGKKYKPGQTIAGNVFIQVNYPVQMRGFHVEFKGSSHVQFSEKISSRDSEGQLKNETEKYTSDEEFYNQKLYIAGGNEGDITIPIGRHTYPFAFLIPKTAPSSFEGEHGHVRHTVRLYMEYRLNIEPWNIDNNTFITYEVIPAETYTNSIGNISNEKPHKLELEKKFRCFCCLSGPLSVVLTLPTTTFCTGQKIPFIIECDNASDIKVNDIVLTLFKITKFHANHPHKKSRDKKIVLNNISVGSVGIGQSKTFREELPISNIELFDLKASRMIELYYIIHVEAKMEGTFPINLRGRIPIKLLGEDAPQIESNIAPLSNQYPEQAPYNILVTQPLLTFPEISRYNPMPTVPIGALPPYQNPMPNVPSGVLPPYPIYNGPPTFNR